MKRWTITLVVALFALSSKDANKSYIIIAFLLAIRRAETLGGSFGKILWIFLNKSSNIIQQIPPY